MEGCIFTNDGFTQRLIKYLNHSELDRLKWDQCIAGSSFETLYPYSWYLDLVSPGWDGLVKGDYEMVMPITHTRKYGFQMILQPILAQQLGVYSSHPLEKADLEEFLSAIPNRFRYVDICLNLQNMDLPDVLRMDKRVNYELRLDDASTEYNTNTRRNLQKGKTLPFDFREISAHAYLDVKFDADREVTVDRKYLERLFVGLEILGRAGAFGLFLDGEFQAAAVLGSAETRVIYMNGCSSAHGKENKAMFVLMERLIEQSRNNFPVFDFEGSNLPGVARFFEGFGATETIYPRIRRTKFPFF